VSIVQSVQTSTVLKDAPQAIKIAVENAANRGK